MPSGRILVVEDRASLRRMLERALSDEGYEVETAADGGQGIEYLRERSYDLVLTDMKLPVATGLDVLEASREAQPEAPVVVLTAYGTVHTAVEAMKLGAVDFLEKPLEIDDLFSACGVTGGGHGGVFLLCRSGLSRNRRLSSPDAGSAETGRESGPDGEHGAADRRKRHRKGALCQGSTRLVAA